MKDMVVVALLFAMNGVMTSNRSMNGLLLTGIKTI